jgi:hypothetical protein
MLAKSINNVLPRQGDLRADGGERQVALGRTEVFIERSLQGVRMRVRLPTRAYRGVVLTLAETSSERALYQVSLWHPDHDFNIVLHEAHDDGEIIATWKSWATYFALPKFIERSPGQLEGAETRVGEVAMGTAPVRRRRGATLSKRRARLPMRRKTGVLSRLGTIYGGEGSGEVWERPSI